MKGIGIIGCGKISQVRHIPEYSDNPNANLVGYFDLARERAEQMAARYGGKVFDTVEDLLADPAIDAVSVCVANNMHADVTIAALKAGKHVLCEKPMATNIEDCERMVAASRQYGRYLMIGQNQRFALAHAEARRLIKQGAIGKVVSFRTTFGHSGPETWSITPGPGTWFFDKKAAVMGVLADLGIHKTDLIQFILDDTITAVTARISTIHHQIARTVVLPTDIGIARSTLDTGMLGIAEDGVAIEQVLIMKTVTTQGVSSPCTPTIVHMTIQIAVVAFLKVTFLRLCENWRQESCKQEKQEKSFHIIVISFVVDCKSTNKRGIEVQQLRKMCNFVAKITIII